MLARVTHSGCYCSIAHLPFLSPSSKILKAFLKTLPTKMKPTKCPAREKKRGKKSEKGGQERKQKVKIKSAVSLLNPNTSTALTTKYCYVKYKASALQPAR